MKYLTTRSHPAKRGRLYGAHLHDSDGFLQTGRTYGAFNIKWIFHSYKQVAPTVLIGLDWDFPFYKQVALNALIFINRWFSTNRPHLLG